MHAPVIAIVHFLPERMPPARAVFDAMVGPLRGIAEIRYRPLEHSATVAFDPALTTLAEIVRTLTHVGAVVTGVSRRGARRASRAEAARFWEAMSSPTPDGGRYRSRFALDPAWPPDDRCADATPPPRCGPDAPLR